MAEEKEDFSAVTNNNDRNNFFALQEVWPPHRPHCLDSSRRRPRPTLSLLLLSLELHTYFSSDSVAVQGRRRRLLP